MIYQAHRNQPKRGAKNTAKYNLHHHIKTWQGVMILGVMVMIVGGVLLSRVKTSMMPEAPTFPVRQQGKSDRVVRTIGVIGKIRKVPWMYGTHYLSKNGYLRYILQSRDLDLDEYIYQIVTVKGTPREHYPVDGAPPLLMVKSIKTEVTFPLTGRAALPDKETLKEIQKKVDNGTQSWRLDPVEVAERESSRFGFQETDTFTLASKEKDKRQNTSIALVVAKHGDDQYILKLIQPIKSGPEGIWITYSVATKLPNIPANWKISREGGLEFRYPRRFILEESLLMDYIGGSPAIIIEELPADPQKTLEDYVKHIKAEYNFKQGKELPVTSKEDKGTTLDYLQKTTIGDNLPAYLFHFWVKEEPNVKQGVCWYLAKYLNKIIKIVVMKEDLEYSYCVEDSTLNRILSSLRIIVDERIEGYDR